MSKNLNETVRLQSEKSGYERSEEGGYKGLERAQVALPVWLAHQPRRSPGETTVRDPLWSDRTGGERRQFLLDLPEIEIE